MQHSQGDGLSLAETVETTGAVRQSPAAQIGSQELIERELRLMSSAWANLTKRIQSDAVVVQRRRQTPSSFLNRQRKILRGPSSAELDDPF